MRPRQDNLTAVMLEMEQASDVEESYQSHSEENTFDGVIGEIEDIIMNESFRVLERQFIERHYRLFESAGDGVEENRLEWMELFQQYCQLVEGHLVAELQQRLPGFDMSTFLEQLAEHQEELEGDIFDLLWTFSDFEAFKEMMVDYRRFKDGDVPNLDGIVTSVHPPT